MGGTMTRRADRRKNDRFDVVGRLWGNLTVTEPVEVVDIGPGGMAARVVPSLPVGSDQTVRAGSSEGVVEVRMRVAHCRPSPDDSGARHHQVGFACVDAEQESWLSLVDQIGKETPPLQD